MKRNPILFCLCGPAGTGKSSVCQALARADYSLQLSISTTTRKPRSGEAEGEHYFFITREEFEQRIESGAFVESALFHENYYGTEIANLDSAFNAGRDVLLDIDVQGVHQLKKLYPEKLVLIFLFPPSFSVLKNRLQDRGTDNSEQVKARLEIAEREIAELRKEDFVNYLLINDDLSQTVERAKAIVVAERQRFRRMDRAELDKLLTCG